MKRLNFKIKPFQNPQSVMNKLIKSVTSTSLPKHTARAMFKGTGSQMLNKFNLKQFGGVNDKDFDGIFNKFDCQSQNPMRQDFTPFRYGGNAEQLTAAKRFGGKNLSKLQRIGQGRDRAVYALDKDKVLKIAKNPGGLTQNTMESNLDYPTGQIKHYETGMDYVVMERAQPPGQATKKMLQHLKKAKSESYNRNKHQQRADFFNSPHFEASGLDATDFSSHSVNPLEFAAKRQWGEKDGQPVLIDGGALMDGQDLSRHRVKDFQQVSNIDKSKEPPWQLTEWQEVQRQRQINKNKGSDKIHYPKSLPEDTLIDLPLTKDYYHGTSRKNAKQIAKTGLIPQGGDKTSEFTEDGFIYATPSKSYAEGYARESFEDPVLLKTTQPVGLFDKEDRKWKGSLSPNEIYITDDIPTVEQAYSANYGNDNFKQNYKNVADFFNSDEQLQGNDTSNNSYTAQSLWHAGDIPPSERLKKEGKVYGFSSKEYADAWKQRHGKKQVYNFVTDKYDIDTQNYSPRKKGLMNDNEFIVYDVKDEVAVNNNPDYDTQTKDLKVYHGTIPEQILDTYSIPNKYKHLK